MAAGNVTVEIVAATTAAVDTSVTALRVNANSKWGFVALAGGQQIMVIHIEEA